MSQPILSTSELEALRAVVDEPNERPGASVLDLGDELPRLRFGESRVGGPQRQERLGYAFDRAAGALENRIADLVLAPSTVEVTFLKQTRYGEFCDAFEVDSRELAMIGVHVAGMPLGGLVAVEPAVVERLVEGMMGGADNGGDLRALGAFESRPLTPLDLRVTKRWVSGFLDDLGKAWNPSSPLQMEVTSGDTSGVAARPFADSTTIVAALLEVGCGDEIVGMIGVVIPGSAVDTLGAPGSAEAGGRDRRRAGPGRLEEDVPDLHVDVDVALGRRRICVRDLLALAVGDVLTIDSRGAATALVQGVPKFVGLPGAVGGRRAFRIQTSLPGENPDAA